MMSEKDRKDVAKRVHEAARENKKKDKEAERAKKKV